jgi:hypothetical protein
MGRCSRSLGLGHPAADEVVQLIRMLNSINCTKLIAGSFVSLVSLSPLGWMVRYDQM